MRGNEANENGHLYTYIIKMKYYSKALFTDKDSREPRSSLAGFAQHKMSEISLRTYMYYEKLSSGKPWFRNTRSSEPVILEPGSFLGGKSGRSWNFNFPV